MSEEAESETRNRGFLTKDDRQYLLGEKDNPPQGSARRQKHLNIRDRLENAILDFQIVAQHLPDKDIEQVSEPLYDWGRDRRRLNEEGRYDQVPESREMIDAWVSLFNFFGYSLALGQLSEMNVLRNLIIQEGLERGYRKYMLSLDQDYINYNADVTVETTERKAMQNHLINIDRRIPEQPNEAAQEILSLYHQYMIPADFAQKLWDEYVVQE